MIFTLTTLYLIRWQQIVNIFDGLQKTFINMVKYEGGYYSLLEMIVNYNNRRN